MEPYNLLNVRLGEIGDTLYQLHTLPHTLGTMKKSSLAEPKLGKRDRSPAGPKPTVTISDTPNEIEPVHEPSPPPTTVEGAVGLSCSLTDVDDVDGPDPGMAQAVRKAEVEKLHLKIQKIMQRIKAEQREKEDNVNEYLRVASASSPDKQQTQRIKAAFEKRNQKSTQVIDQLQRKLESYKKRLHEARLSTTSINPRHKQTKNVFRDVGQGLKDVGANIKEGITGFSGTLASKPKDLVSLVKNKFSSADNISTLKDDAILSEEPEKISQPGSNTLPAGNSLDESALTQRKVDMSSGGQHSAVERFKYASDDEASSMTSGSFGRSGTQSTPPQAGVSMTSQLTSQMEMSPGDLGSLLIELHDVQETQNEILQEVQNFKSQMQIDYNFMKQSLEEERYRSDRLEEQINDLTELHQHEVTNLKQEMSGMEEKMEYQLDERTRDLQEALENCQTRITKMELQLQQQRLISMEGIENSTFRALVTKLINVALGMLAVILVFISTISNFASPFLTSRLRGITTFFFLVIMISLYRNRDLVMHLWVLFTNAHGMDIYRSTDMSESSHQEESAG
ncbi:Transmembrane and coiled-coil domains protein 2 [Lamellibrachia satsuma]|nr:Transmembrane and coiled-coil domains protein 2 [Lamellibrachia satsuma]